MKRPHLFFLLALLMLTFAAFTAERPVIYLRLTDSLTIDPGKIEEYFSQEVIFNVFEGLVRLRQDRLEVEPCLAERWLMRENGRHWIFFLRRGVRFHNGDALTARAVVYSFKKRLANRSGEYVSFGRFFPYVLDVRALDDWTVEFLLSRSYAPFLLALVDQRANIVAPGAMDGPAFKPIGTGPFVVSEWLKGRSIVLDRFTGYWQPPVGLARLIFKCEPNEAQRLTQVKNRSADINIIRSAKEYEELLGRTDIAIISEPTLSTHYLGFNCRRPPFSSLPARKAFFHLLDRKTLVKQVFQNFAAPASGMLPPKSLGFDAQLGKDDFSLHKARQLLRQAGLERGFSCSLFFSEGQFGLEEVARAIAAKARLVGVHVKCVKHPFRRMFQMVKEGTPDLFLLGWGFAGDPGVLMNPMFMLYPGARGNTMSASPDFVRLLAQADVTEEDAKRVQVYEAVQRQLHEDMPLIPLFYLNHILAYNTRLRNLRMNPFSFIFFKDAEAAAE